MTFCVNFPASPTIPRWGSILNQIALAGGKDCSLKQLVGQINLTLADLCPLAEVHVGGHEFQISQECVELRGHGTGNDVVHAELLSGVWSEGDCRWLPS